MTERKRYLILSDLHLGAGHPWDWIAHEGVEQLAELFDRTATDARSTLAGAVLLGDTWDDWVWPYDLRPPPLLEIASSPAARPALDALRRLARQVPVTVVEGNHDAGLTSAMVDALIPGARFEPLSWSPPGAAVWCEHGHMLSLFNAPDPEARRLPLGYWITRALTHQSGRKFGEIQVARTAIDDLLEAVFTSQTVAEAAWEAVVEAAGLKMDTRLISPTGAEITARSIGLRYRHLLDRHEALMPRRDYLLRLLGDVGKLEHPVQLRHGWRVAILGHSHRAGLKMLDHGRVVANCGSWSHDGGRHHLVLVVEGDMMQVELRRWKDGRSEFIQQMNCMQ